MHSLFFILSAFLLVSAGCCKAQQLTPPAFFETQYTDAEAMVKESRQLIDSICRLNNIDPALAVSVVFPEMLRYSLWKDFFETRALETFYIRSGSSTADFSIGWFQIKPSFAESVENQLLLWDSCKSGLDFACKYQKPITMEMCRKCRIERLKSFEWQVKYVVAFIQIMTPRLRQAGIAEKDYLTYLAAAYNRGLNTDITLLSNFLKTKTFPYGPGYDNPFGYAEVSHYYYTCSAGRVFKGQQ